MTIDQLFKPHVTVKLIQTSWLHQKSIKVRHVGLEKVKLIRTADKETKLLEA